MLYVFLKWNKTFSQQLRKQLGFPHFLPTHTHISTQSMPLPSTMRHTCSSSELYIYIAFVDVHSVSHDQHSAHCTKEHVCRGKQSIYAMWLRNITQAFNSISELIFYDLKSNVMPKMTVETGNIREKLNK